MNAIASVVSLCLPTYDAVLARFAPESTGGRLHLSMVGQRPLGENGVPNDFSWNHDYTAYRALPCRWWDDASYAAYQSDNGDEYEFEAVIASCSFDVERVARRFGGYCAESVGENIPF